MNSNIKNKKGYTLVELAVVIIIIGILSGVASISYTGTVRSAKIVEAIQGIQTIAQAEKIYFAKYGKWCVPDSDAVVKLDNSRSPELVNGLDSTDILFSISEQYFEDYKYFDKDKDKLNDNGHNGNNGVGWGNGNNGNNGNNDNNGNSGNSGDSGDDNSGNSGDSGSGENNGSSGDSVNNGSNDNDDENTRTINQLLGIELKANFWNYRIEGTEESIMIIAVAKEDTNGSMYPGDISYIVPRPDKQYPSYNHPGSYGYGCWEPYIKREELPDERRSGFE